VYRHGGRERPGVRAAGRAVVACLVSSRGQRLDVLRPVQW
jgi:hypothetical protein